MTDGYLAIRVRDTGFGIPAEDLDRIFTRFYRVKDTKTRYIHGTRLPGTIAAVVCRNGSAFSRLGLSIVKSIVEAHHGSIRVESRPDQGSTFTVRLPFSNEAP